MTIVMWLVSGFIFGYWSNILAKEKGKPSPGLRAIAGFFLYVIPVVALHAVHSKSEIQKLLEDSKNP